MIPSIVSTPESLAALLGAPFLAFAAEDAVLVALVVAGAAAVALVVGVALPRLRRERDGGQPPGGIERRAVRPASVGLPDDPIVAALGLGDDESLRARRRRRPIGGSLQYPPGDSPPPT